MHIAKSIATYQKRPKQIERYARRVAMKVIAEHDFSVNISRYVSMATAEGEMDLAATQRQLVVIDEELRATTKKHNAFLNESGPPPLP